jgi:hypothetical protein
MKIAFYTILIVLVSLLYNTVCRAQVHKLDSVKVEFEGFNTETIADVSCEVFDSAFKDTKKIKGFYDKVNLSQFKSLAEDFKQQKEKRALDVRGTIIYHYGITSVKYCFNVFGYFYKDGKLYYNKKLLIAISDKIYKNHPQYLDTLRRQ